MLINKDRMYFYEELQYCKSREEIKVLIDRIKNNELKNIMKDKYNQIIEFNEDEDVKNIIKILEYTYLKFEKNT